MALDIRKFGDPVLKTRAAPVESFDESLVLARRRLGLRSILYGRPGAKASGGRVNASRPRGDEIPAALRKAAEDCNRHDIALYEHALELFESAPEHEGRTLPESAAAPESPPAEKAETLPAPAPSAPPAGWPS